MRYGLRLAAILACAAFAAPVASEAADSPAAPAKAAEKSVTTTWLPDPFPNLAPRALDRQAIVEVDTPRRTPSVLLGVYDVENDPLSVTSFTQPAHGSAMLEKDGTLPLRAPGRLHRPRRIHLHAQRWPRRTLDDGHATILGDNPLQLAMVEEGVFKSDPSPYAGRYPCGSLVHNGVWYYGTYCLHPSGRVEHDGMQYNWPWLGPFVGFRWSTDFGMTWSQTPHTPEKPLFGEIGLHGEPVKIGSPHFVDFGKAMEHSPDGKAYLVAHGASDGSNRRFAYNSWITGDEIYLFRVKPSIETMNDAQQYEFFAGHDSAGKAVWTHDLKQSKPIAAWKDNMGCVTMTYNAPLKKYLMCVTDGGTTVGDFNTYLLEADSITGPFQLVTYLKQFGEQAYFVTLPSKFISADGKTMWLCYAANFSSGRRGTQGNPRGSRYAMCLQEIQLGGGKVPKANALERSDNLARTATISASSTHPDYSISGLTDCDVGGYPGDISKEWCTKDEKESAMVRLTWPREQEVNRIWLFDRPNPLDQITSAVILFSDGSTLKVGALPDDAKSGLEITFSTRKVRWLVVLVDTVKPSTRNIGMAEIAVFGPKAN